MLIKDYFLRGKTISENKAELDKYYSDSGPSYGITTPEMINKIHDTVLNDPKGKVGDCIHLNWACGKYFAYIFKHEKAISSVNASIGWEI